MFEAPKVRALGHVTDLFPTLLSIAGGNPAPGKTGPLDGVDLSTAWKAGSNDGPRKELVYNIDPLGLAAVASSFMTGGRVVSAKIKNGFDGRRYDQAGNQW